MKHIILTVALSLLGVVHLPAADSTASTLYLDPEQPLEKRVQNLISQLTLEQKAQLLNHRGPTVKVGDYSIRADQWNQCLNGVKWDRPTTLFPLRWNEKARTPTLGARQGSYTGMPAPFSVCAYPY